MVLPNSKNPLSINIKVICMSLIYWTLRNRPQSRAAFIDILPSACPVTYYDTGSLFKSHNN